MAKTKISEFDIDPANNTDINSINIAEGCAPSGINNAIRQLMSDLKEFQTGAGGDPFNGAVNGTVGATTPNTGAFTTLSASSTATLNTLSSSGATITGGSINGTTVGATTASTGKFTSVTNTGLTSGRVTYATTGGLLTDSATFTYDGTSLSVGSATVVSANDIISATKSGELNIRVNCTNTTNGANLILSSGNGTTSSLYSYATYKANQTSAVNWYTGLYGSSSYTINNGSDRLVINSSGNVGIGTSSPSFKLDVVGLVASQDAYLITANSSGTPSAGAFIFRPASNTIALGTNSAERMRLDSSGNLLLGTTAQYNGGKFEMAGTSSDFVSTRFVNAAGGANIYLQHSRGASVGTNTIVQSGDTLGTIVFSGANGTTFSDAAYIQAAVDGTPGASADMPGRLVFYTSADGSATPTERMRLDSSGNLGLGVTPSAWSSYKALQVNEASLAATTSSNTVLSSNAYFDGTNWKYIYSNYASRYLQLSGAHSWHTAASGTAGNNISYTQAMTLDASGRLGIGTTSPTTKLQVTGSIYSDNNGLNCFLLNSAGSYYGSIQNDAADKWSLGYAAASGSLGTPVLTWNSSGNVGIGTTSPSARFHVSSSSAETVIGRFQSSGATASYIGFAGSGASTTYDVRCGAAGTNIFAIATGDTERMRIDSSGNLLFNTTSNANSSRVRISSSNPTTGYVLELQQTSSNAGTYYYQAFYVNTTQTGYISSDGTTTTYATSSDYRLKENVAPMTGALAKNALLKPVTYTWKADGSVGEGFIAHELAEVMPDAVTGEKDAVNEDGSIKPQGIDTSFLVGHLVACIQELKAEVDSLKAQLNK